MPYSTIPKIFQSGVVRYSSQLFNAANPNCLALQKVVEVIATEEMASAFDNNYGNFYGMYCIHMHNRDYVPILLV